MSLSKGTLTGFMESALQGAGYAVEDLPTSSHTKVNKKFIQALAEAIVKEIQTNAQVPVAGGSSAGNYKVT